MTAPSHDIEKLKKELQLLRQEKERLIRDIERETQLRFNLQNKLNELQALNEIILEVNPDLVYLFDREGNIMQSFYGSKIEESALPAMLLGRTIEESLPKKEALLTRQKLKILFETKQQQNYIFKIDTDEETRHFHAKLAIYGKKHAIAIIRDISEQERARRALLNSTKEYRKFYTMLRLMSDTMPDLVWAKDLRNRYIFVNKATCEKLLKARDTNEPIGKTDLFFANRERNSHPDDPEWYTFGEQCNNSDKKTLEALKPMQFEEFGNVRGKFLYLDVHKAPLFDEDGKLIGIVGSGRDITEQKRIENQLVLSEKTFRGIINSISEAVYIQNRDGTFLDVNHTAEKIYGYSREFFIGKTPAIISAPGKNDIAKIAKLVEKAYQGEPQLFEFWGMRNNGTIFPKTVSVTPGEYYGKRCVIAVARDITQQKRWEAELIAQKKKAEENDRLKSAFLANISHEIRTPMNGILGFAQLLKAQLTNDSKASSYLQVIEKSGQRMLELLNNIICISKIESGQETLSLTMVNLSSLLDELLIYYRIQAEEKGITLKLIKPGSPNDYTLETDKSKLETILHNLLKNAIKYTDSGGKITLRYKAEGQEIRFTVTDTGIGIPVEKQQHIFERFVQADLTLTSNYEGAGLGLAISKAYVALLGGKIGVESIPGKGSIFYFTIPVNR